MGKETAKTSLNQVPALHRKALVNLSGQHCILDYGCGKYSKGESFVRSSGHVWVGYDPYNRDKEDNEISLMLLDTGLVDTILCANVLNVTTKSERLAIYRDLKKAKTVFISVYEGDKGDIRKGNQENKPLKNYLTELKQHFSMSKVTAKGGVICIKS